MALNLGKRKRDNEASSRKTRKVSPTEDSDEPGFVDLEAETNDSGSEAGGDEDEEWGGIPSNARPTGASGASVMPSSEQVRVMKDANELYRSSSFKLQIDALLPNVRPKYSKSQPLDKFLMTLHSFLGNVSSISPANPLEAAKKLRKKGISVPYSAPQPTEDVKWKVAFEKPSGITLVGSWANKISVKSKDGVNFGVDMAVDMPSNLFQEKDYLDGRFFHKRAFYLAALASAIQDKKNGLKQVEVLYDCPSGDVRLTTLILRSRTTDEESTNFTKQLHSQVNIIPVLPEDSPIPYSRLSPSHVNLRDPNAQEHNPTPLYNTALLNCTSLVAKSDLLTAYDDKQSCAAFEDALALLRIWANQRGFARAEKYGIRGFEAKGPFWNALLHYLVAGDQSPAKSGLGARRPVGRGLSSYQMFRAALDFLSKHKFDSEPVFVKGKEGSTAKISSGDYHGLLEDGTPVFVESSSCVNLLSGVPLGSLDLIQHDARQTLETLNEATPSQDPFKDVFLLDRRDLATRFDAVLRVDLSSAEPRNPFSSSVLLDAGSESRALLSSISSILRRGLDNRTKAVAIIQPSPASFSVSQSSVSKSNVIHIGLIYDTENAFRLVDQGPAADDPDPSSAEAFRKLWGSKAELRRFKDGRIVESVVWEVTTAEERMHVPSLVVTHLLKHHFGVSGDAVTWHQQSFDKLLKLPEQVASKVAADKDVKPGFKSAITAFDGIVRAIRDLDEELPLRLVNVSAVSEYLRYTSTFAPVPLPPSLASRLPPTARYLPELEMILEFEKSSRWPDELKAIQKIKLAFFETIASALMKSVEGLEAHVVVGDGVTTSEIVDQGRLVLLTPEGWAFSARIWHDREATLLDRIIEDKAKAKKFPGFRAMNEGKDELYSAQEVDHAKEIHVRRFVHAPRHHRAITTLCHQHSAFAGTVRLVKRWLASHWLLRGHVSEEAAEILCAQFFASSKPVSEDKTESKPGIPGSKERGFALVIEFLKDWRWDQEELFVPLYAQSTLPASPASLPSTSVKHGVWKITTEMDKEGRIWTTDSPQVVTANRVRALAQATWELMKTVGEGSFNPEAMFSHPSNDYNVVLELDPTVLPRYAQNVTPESSLIVSSKFANMPSKSEDVRPGFNPAQLFVDDLQRVYEGTLKVFYDPLGGTKIGAIWDPSLLKPRPFRVLGAFSPMPAPNEKSKSKEQAVVLNQNAVIREIQRMGSGLVKSIMSQ